jgi:hypothetical protein
MFEIRARNVQMSREYMTASEIRYMEESLFFTGLTVRSDEEHCRGFLQVAWCGDAKACNHEGR